MVAMIVSAPGFCKPAVSRPLSGLQVAYGPDQVDGQRAVDRQVTDRWTRYLRRSSMSGWRRRAARRSMAASRAVADAVAR